MEKNRRGRKELKRERSGKEQKEVEKSKQIGKENGGGRAEEVEKRRDDGKKKKRMKGK